MVKKTWASIFVLVAIISFSGCMTATFKGKEKGPSNVLASEATFTKALTERPKNIPAMLTWGADGSLDTINNEPAQQQVTVIDKARIKFLGWAGNIEKGTVPQDAYLEFDGPTHAYFKITTRLKRPDVVAYFNKPGLKESGWVAYVDLTALAIGAYKVKIIQIEGKTGSSSDTSRSFKLGDPGMALDTKVTASNKTAPKTIPGAK